LDLEKEAYEWQRKKLLMYFLEVIHIFSPFWAVLWLTYPHFEVIHIPS
jgi:hypothetical protein